MSRAVIVSGIGVAFATLLAGQALFQKPVKVLGDPDFIGTAANPGAYATVGPNWVEGKELNAPAGVALDNSVTPPILYIADSGNNRVLGYRYSTQLIPGAPADIIIGQVDRFSNQAQNPANGGRQTGLNNPTGLAVDANGNLYVADTGNNRILRYPQPFNSANANEFPTLWIGQKSLATSTANLNGLSASTLNTSQSGAGRTGIAFDPSGNLWVADTGNNRALRFPAAALAAGSSFPAADMVIGQAAFNTSAQGQGAAALTGLGLPNGISVSSSGSLFITDQFFRVLVFSAPLSTGMAASNIIGGSSATTPTANSLSNPTGVVSVTSGLVVADAGNNRLTVYASPGTSSAATAVIGQNSFSDNSVNKGGGDASASSFHTPSDVASGNQELYVADSNNNRVLVFTLSPAGVGASATRVIGQLDFPYTGANLVDGKGFSFANGFPAGAVLDNSVAPARLYVPDTFNNRILGFSDFTHLQDGQPADIVIGQPDFYRSVINYPSGDASAPNSSGLYQPTALTVDSAGNLYVTDSGNGRVLRFPAPFASGKTALEDADLVLGQSSFTSDITDPTSVTLGTPVGIALTADGFDATKTNTGWLVVADAEQNRVVLFKKPFVSGMSMSVVLGQPGFTSSTASSTSRGLSSPRAVAVDPQEHVLVADTTNARVEVFDQAANLGTGAAALISLTGVFSAPVSVSAGPSGDFWVADSTAGRMIHYPSVANLPQVNNAADAAVSMVSPHSVFVDKANNVVATDGINRVLYFVPQINLTNAASYSTRELSAGTVAALFPTVAADPIANGTDTAPASQFPLPTTLADTQITVNGTPVPLLYVSPAQDNIVLPQNLVENGSADLLAVRASTGQIIAGAELELAPSSPGLFTADASGAGQILAVNLPDGSVNSTTHPVIRGNYVILYGTGVGPVPNPPADGMPATGQSASDLPTVLIAASTGSGTSTLIPATVTYSGLAPGFAGLWQINVQIPMNAQSGNNVVIKVYEKDRPNLDQTSSLNTTLAIN
ncbi:MAG TPA: hypothetical protein VHC90_22485 [Bryobacteraceae bacterium]|nr:hypothetical protein [Bryobacteraceae bacterium]